MTIEGLFQEHRDGLRHRVERMVGSRETAEDLCQEAFLRAWRHAPAHLDAGQQAAWLYRTASNLAVDELRRRGPRRWEELSDAAGGGAQPDELEVVAAREALARLSAHERLVVLLRLQAGLSHAEIGALLDLSPEAARKRVDRARRRFAAAYRGVRPDRRPVVLLLAREDPGLYATWLGGSGADVRLLGEQDAERQLAAADAFVLSGSLADIDPGLYGERPRRAIVGPDLRRDRRDVRALRAALALDLPIVGVCRGHQLLNVILGGTLYQDVEEDGAAAFSHRRDPHPIETRPETVARRVLGRRPEVSSGHHQALRRLGRGVGVTATSPEGLVEMVELPRPVLTMGLQWHPEHAPAGRAGRRIADALVAAATRRAA